MKATGRDLENFNQGLIQGISKTIIPESSLFGGLPQVVMVIITDGHENASRELKKSQIKKMIKNKTEKFDWNFVFLSADMESIGDARDLGIDPDAILAHKKTGQEQQK